MHVLLVDWTNVLSRAFYGMRQPPADKVPPRALSMLHAAVTAMEATHCVLALDHPAPTFRKLLDPGYKESRSKKVRAVSSDDLIQAAAPWVDAAGLCHVAAPGFEGDDTLATLATRMSARARVSILSSDNDLRALVNDRIAVYSFASDAAASGMARYVEHTPESISAEYGFSHTLIPQWKAIAGESGDDIAGVPGIGPKRATEIIQLHGSLEAALAAAETTPEKSVTARLRGQQAAAHLGLALATLRSDAPIPPILPASCSVRRVQWNAKPGSPSVATPVASPASVTPASPASPAPAPSAAPAWQARIAEKLAPPTAPAAPAEGQDSQGELLLGPMRTTPSRRAY
jgi:5'-3' exonuclease